jgi:hypothetical protein
MTAHDAWQPFGVPADEYEPPAAGKAPRVLNLTLGSSKDETAKDRAGTWLRNAMLALGLLAAAAAVVSFEAQYRMVLAAKGVRLVAALEAGIPDVSAVVFAALGIALALQGRRALRPRALNVAAVATSIGMNYLAAAGGWRDAAIWVMPSVAYAVASDTAIGVIRAYAIARQQELRKGLADDETSPLAVLGGLLLWQLRLVLAPRSTLAGFRQWALDSCPVAPGRSVAAERALEAQAVADRLALTAAQATTDADAAQGEAESARAELAGRLAAHETELERVRVEGRRAAEQVWAEAKAQVAAASAAREEALATAAGNAAAASASAQDAERARAQAQAAEREREEAREQAAGEAMAAARAWQVAQDARAELERARADAAQQMTQAREDTDRRWDRLQAALRASVTTAAAVQGRGKRHGSRPASKRSQLIEAYEALSGTDDRYGNRAKASEVARELAPRVGLEWGSARTYLYKHLDGRAAA